MHVRIKHPLDITQIPYVHYTEEHDTCACSSTPSCDVMHYYTLSHIIVSVSLGGFMKVQPTGDCTEGVIDGDEHLASVPVWIEHVLVLCRRTLSLQN